MPKPISTAAETKVLSTSPTSALTIAGELNARVVDDLMNRVVPWTKESRDPPPCLAYVTTVGVGKTAAIVHLVEHALAQKLRVAIRTPTLELGLELLARLEKVVPGGVGLWRGREQSDPTFPESAMCRRVDDVKAAQSVGGVPTDVCGSKKRGFCPFHPDGGDEEPCGYLSQMLGLRQVVIFSGDPMLQLAPRRGVKRAGGWKPYKAKQVKQPSLLDRINNADVTTRCCEQDTQDSTADSDLPDFDLLILDETEPVSFLAGFDLPPISLSKDAFRLLTTSISDPVDEEILSGFLSSIQEACCDVGAGGYLAPLKLGECYHDLTHDQICTLNLGDQDAPIYHSERTMNDFIDILYTVREVAFENLPAPVGKKRFHKLTAAHIKEINAETVKVRSLLLGVARVCEIMRLGLQNDLPILRHLKVAADSGAIFLRRKKPLSPHYSDIPTMIFDATLRPELLQHTFENLEIAYERFAKDGNGVQRFQLRDRDLSYGTLKATHWPARLWLFACMNNRMHGSTGLLVPKAIRENLLEEDQPAIQIGHFGALRGLNSFENVSALIVASRTAIGPAEAEDIAAVLSGQNVYAIPAGQKWYPDTNATIRWRDNPSAGWITRHVEHPDPTVEAVRAAITEDSLEQALGRGRNVRRFRNRPLVEYILTTTPTNRPVDGTFSMAEFKAVAGWVGAFLELGVWFEGGTKGMGGVLHAFSHAMYAQRPESLLVSLIGDPAFEGPDAAADWRKKQVDDNPEIGALAREIDKALGARAESVEMLCAQYPIFDFAPVEAKVRGSRYFARMYVRTGEEQTADEALTTLLGPVAGELEIRSASGA